MKFFLALLMLSLALVGGCEKVADKRGVVAREWLRDIDHGQFDTNWKNSATYLKDQLEREEWFLGLERANEERGLIKSRNLIGCSAKSGFYNGPKGEYAVCVFISVYALRPEGLVEVITLIRTGHWKVIHYVVN